jgi:8-oxo-dGTP diphosphatase
MTFTYRYPRPALTVDIVVFALDENDLQVMLIQRDQGPFEGDWALPGGFVNVDETLDAAAARELEEETGLRDIFLEQLYTFGDVDRDPRERVVTVAYYALVNLAGHNVRAASDARNAAWFSVNELPDLAFDHRKILNVALDRLRGKVRYQPVGFELLPEKFTLRQLQTLYETILDRRLDKRNFRKKVQGMEILKATNEIEKDVSHRAAQLYRFNKKAYDRLMKQGFNFEI